MDPGQLATVSDGRVFSGRQSVPLKLVDELGSERQAVGVAGERPRRPEGPADQAIGSPRPSSDFSLWSAAGIGADLLGLDGLAARLRAVGAEAQAAAAAGCSSLWRPASLNAAGAIRSPPRSREKTRRHDQVGARPQDRRAEPASLPARRRDPGQRDPRHHLRRAGPGRPGGAARLRRVLGEASRGAPRDATRARARPLPCPRRRSPCSRPARRCASASTPPASARAPRPPNRKDL